MREITKRVLRFALRVRVIKNITLLKMAPGHFFELYRSNLSTGPCKALSIISTKPHIILFGRGREIRTPDILLPKQARYQTALYPDIF